MGTMPIIRQGPPFSLTDTAIVLNASKDSASSAALALAVALSRSWTVLQLVEVSSSIENLVQQTLGNVQLHASGVFT